MTLGDANSANSPYEDVREASEFIHMKPTIELVTDDATRPAVLPIIA